MVGGGAGELVDGSGSRYFFFKRLRLSNYVNTKKGTTLQFESGKYSANYPLPIN